MSEEMIVRHCSPTLAGLKTGNLFLCKVKSASEICRHIEKFNKRLGYRGIKMVLLRLRKGKAMIYIYRPHHLRKVLRREDVRVFLRERGYRGFSVEEVVETLSERVAHEEDFPHEIGIFLGYPLEDVEGYVSLGGKSAKFCGHWKVYANVEEAERTFLLYKKCTNLYCKQHARGVSLHKLTVNQGWNA